MDMDLPHCPYHSNTIWSSKSSKSSNGCWTCRLRRKKCNEEHPVCEACAALYITCYYSRDRPEWMDGGLKQEEMAERVKREVKEKAYSRRGGERAINISGDRLSFTEAATGEPKILPQKPPMDLAPPIFDPPRAISDAHNDQIKPCPEASTPSLQRETDCTLTSKKLQKGIAFGRSDTILLMFYLEHLFPFLFPFYHPSLLQGGRAWILEMMISSPVVQQITLCQSSYFFSLAQGAANQDMVWEKVLTQTRDAFEVLRRSLQVIYNSNIKEHLHGAVRIMASIIQMQRFEIAVLSFNNCQAHLNAALTLFQQLLDSTGVTEQVGPSSSFNTVRSCLGLLSSVSPTQYAQIPSAEQAAFRFSSTLLILDDIIASTMLQEQPTLYEYHRNLLGAIDGTEPPINLEVAVGCQNWALLEIGEIAVLDAWKQRCKRAGNLNVIELVHRATAIKNSLEAHLTRLETDPVVAPKKGSSLLDIFTADYGQQSKSPVSQTSLVTRVWAHAALVYLFVVVSGWQPASVDVRYHVGQIIELLTHQISPSALLRTMVWPFCVAGCLAETAQEAHLRGMVEELQPPNVFGTMHKALEIMENVWRNRNAGDATNRDLATCFRSQGDLVLLV